MRRVALTANGVRHDLEIEPRELLVYVLRERLGLTGTNVGCDTSSCGACTVLVNGESVKSCTMLGVQADGMDITTIEGLARNGELHPVQQAFHDHHALQCGYCTPGMVLAAVSLIDEWRSDRRGGDPRRARGEPLPLHRVPQHRPGRRGSCRGGVMTAVESAPKVIGTSVKRKEDASLLRGLGTFVDNLTLPATVNMAVVRSPYPRARITGVNLDAARAAEGVVAAFSGADLAGDWEGGLPCAWPVTEDIKMPPHFPLATDEARYQGDGVAVVVAESRALAKDAAELVEVDYEPLPSIADVAKALDDGTPLVHGDLGTNECYVWKLETDDVQAAIDAADVVVTRRYFQPRLIPNAIEPRGVLAQVGPTDDVTLWSATQMPHILRFALQLVARNPRVEDPRDRSGRGRRVRVQAQRLRAKRRSRSCSRSGSAVP